MAQRSFDRTTRHLVSPRLLQITAWTALNVALAVVFTLLLHVDDRIARAAGF